MIENQSFEFYILKSLQICKKKNIQEKKKASTHMSKPNVTS